MANPRPIGQEPTLDEMLSEPIVRLVMSSDRVTYANVKDLVEAMKNGRLARRDACATRMADPTGTQMAISNAPSPVERQSGPREQEISSMEPQVFDGATNIWLEEIMAELDCDRQLAWQILGAVLQCLRTRLPIDLAAHLTCQLPVLIRDSCYGHGTPKDKPLGLASRDGFLEDVSQSLASARPVNVYQAVQTVFRTISRHVTDGHVRKMRDTLPRDLAAMWPHGVAGASRSHCSFREAGRGPSTQVTLARAGAFSES